MQAINDNDIIKSVAIFNSDNNEDDEKTGHEWKQYFRELHDLQLDFCRKLYQVNTFPKEERREKYIDMCFELISNIEYRRFLVNVRETDGFYKLVMIKFL